MNLLRELIKELSTGLNPAEYPPQFFKNHLSFRLKNNRIEAVKHPHIPDINAFLFVDRQKEVLLRNTQQFVEGYPANDVLLWGARGTGKSSLVKALLGVFGDRGLRIVQLYKDEIPELADLYEVLRGKEEKFILFFDDLSFEPHEDSFKLLKSLLEGDIEERPPNVLVYATTNRRNLIPEVEEEEKFPEESVQERVSLVERFGIRLQFLPFSQQNYLEIVKKYLDTFGVEFNEEIRREALRWAIERGSFSGRVAFQFVKDLLGRLRIKADRI